jgi:hypothetical protein
MPRFLVAVIAILGGCSFDARYSEGVPCTDGECPSGLVCHLERCVAMIPVDMMIDVPPPEGPPPALTCADPGVFPATGGTVMATTVGGTSKMSSLCTGLVHNGPDRVYQIMMNGAQSLRVSVEGGRKGYVLLMPCIESPNTPMCFGAARATAGNPITVTPMAAGPVFVVVDDELAGASSTYTLTLTVL